MTMTAMAALRVLGAFASSFAGSFVELLLACILLGLGQGAVNPCSFALLGDYFSASNRGLVFGTSRTTHDDDLFGWLVGWLEYLE